MNYWIFLFPKIIRLRYSVKSYILKNLVLSILLLPWGCELEMS